MTLTEAAFWTRRLSIIGVVLLLFLVLFVYIFFIWQPEVGSSKSYISANYGCTETKEEFLEAKLEIPSLDIANPNNLSFEIDTQSGTLESLPGVVNIYKYNNPGQSINAQTQAKNLADKMGFNPNSMIRVSVNEYRWEDKINARTLNIKARDLNFTLDTNFKSPFALPGETNLPKGETAVSLAKTALNTLKKLPTDYSNGEAQFRYINIQPDGSFTEAKSIEEAELIRVDFYRNKSVMSVNSNWDSADKIKDQWDKFKFLNGYTTSKEDENGKMIDFYEYDAPVFMLNTQKSYISVYVGTTNQNIEEPTMKNIYKIDYNYHEIEEDACGTYDLISASSALEQVKQGKGSLVYLNENGGDNVVEYNPLKVNYFTITNVYLGYYDSPDEQEFLQPIYIISGEASLEGGIRGKFYYYVPAVNYNIVKDSTKEVSN